MVVGLLLNGRTWSRTRFSARSVRRKLNSCGGAEETDWLKAGWLGTLAKKINSAARPCAFLSCSVGVELSRVCGSAAEQSDCNSTINTRTRRFKISHSAPLQ